MGIMNQKELRAFKVSNYNWLQEGFQRLLIKINYPELQNLFYLFYTSFKFKLFLSNRHLNKLRYS